MVTIAEMKKTITERRAEIAKHEAALKPTAMQLRIIAKTKPMEYLAYRKKEIPKAKKIYAKAREELKEYEKEVEKYEKETIAYEAAKRSYEKRLQALKWVKKRIPWAYVKPTDPELAGYMKEYYEMGIESPEEIAYYAKYYREKPIKPIAPKKIPKPKKEKVGIGAWSPLAYEKLVEAGIVKREEKKPLVKILGVSIPKPKDIYEKIYKKVIPPYAKAELFVKQKLGITKLPTIAKIEKTAKVIMPEIITATYPTPIKKIIKKTKIPLIKATYPEMAAAEVTAAYREVKERPLKFATTAGAFFAASGLLGATKAVFKPLGKIVPSTIKKIAPTAIAVGLPAYYGYTIVTRAAEVPAGYPRARKLAEIKTGEITPMLVGGYVGMKFWPKAVGFVRTIGYKKLPPEKIIAPKILKGKEMFPRAPEKVHLKKFLEARYRLPYEKKPAIWHTTPKSWEKVTMTGIGKRWRKEMAGVYGAPSVSPYFLRAAPTKYGLYGKQLFPEIGKPTIIRLRVKKIVALPAKFRIPKPELVMGLGKAKYAPAVKWLIKKAPKEKAYVPMIKTEIEAVIPPYAPVKRIAVPKYYTTWKGIRIPIHVYEVGIKPPTTKIPFLKPKTPAITKEISYYYPYKPTKAYTIYPAYFAYYKPSLLYRPYYAPPSKIMPYKPPIYYPPTKPYKIIPYYISPPKYPVYTVKTPPYYLPPPTYKVPVYYPTTKLPYILPPPPPKPSLRALKPARKRVIKLHQAYQPFVRRKGIFKPVGKPVTRAEAIRLGEKIVKRTLAATFMIKPKGMIPMIERPYEYEPSPRIFRKYKIQKKIKRPLKDVWIQKAKFRLAAPSEVKEIQIAKKKKARRLKFKWL